MKSTGKRWIMAGCIILLIACLTAFAEEDIWSFDADEGKLTQYAGAGGDVVVPSEIDGTSVKKLGTSLLNNDPAILSVGIPEGIAHLDGSVCAWNNGLKRVRLPDSLLVMEDSCLSCNPAMTEITIPPAVCWVGHGCLGFNDNLRSIVFTGPCPEFRGDCLAALPNDAVVSVPDDEYGAYAAALKRANCEIEIRRSGQNAVRPEPAYDTENLVFDAETGTITGYTGSAVRLDIPETIGGAQVKFIGNSAFERHPTLSYVSLPEGLTGIGEKAFALMRTLHFVKLPSTLTTIADKAFEGAYRVGALIFPDGLVSIGKEAFTYCTVRGEIVFPKSLTSIGEKAFAHSSWLDSLYIPASVSEIGGSAFEDCAVTYVYMDGLTLPKLGDRVFGGCGELRDIDLNTKAGKEQMLDMQAYTDALGLSCRVWRNQNPEVSYTAKESAAYSDAKDGTMLFSGYTGNTPNIRPYDTYDNKNLTGIADGALKGNTVVTYFSVPYNDVFTTIGAEAFKNSVLEQVDLFDSVTTIGAGAFQNCVRLKELTLPTSVTSVGKDAFAGCTGLKKVTVLCDPGVLPENAFSGCKVDELRVRDSASDDEIAALSDHFGLPWHHPALRLSEQSAFQTMPFTPTEESQFSFNAETGTITSYNGTAVDVVIPRSIGGVPVVSFAYNAFDSARDYTDTEISNNQTQWLRLRSVVIPETIVSIPDSLFNFCQQLETVVCYAPLETTARNTFNFCRRLKTAIFVNGVRMIDNYAFQDTPALETVYTGRTLDEIGACAFLRSGLADFAADTGANISLPDIEALIAAYASAPADTPTPAPTAEIPAAPVPVGGEGMPFLGHWRGTSMTEGGKTYAMEELGLSFRLTLNEDGTALLETGDKTDNSVWTVKNGRAAIEDLTLVVRQDGTLSVKEGDTDMIFERENKAMPAQSAAAPAPAVGAPGQKTSEAAPEQYLEQKYVCVSASAEGYPIQASMLGGEYSIVFHENGTAIFVLAGQALPPMTWEKKTAVSPSGAEEEAFAVNYLNSGELLFFPAENGFDLNFFNSMLMRFEPSER